MMYLMKDKKKIAKKTHVRIWLWGIRYELWIDWSLFKRILNPWFDFKIWNLPICTHQISNWMQNCQSFETEWFLNIVNNIKCNNMLLSNCDCRSVDGIFNAILSINVSIDITNISWGNYTWCMFIWNHSNGTTYSNEIKWNLKGNYVDGYYVCKLSVIQNFAYHS